jgi:hypothetical protein
MEAAGAAKATEAHIQSHRNWTDALTAGAQFALGGGPIDNYGRIQSAGHTIGMNEADTRKLYNIAYLYAEEVNNNRPTGDELQKLQEFYLIMMDNKAPKCSTCDRCSSFMHEEEDTSKCCETCPEHNTGCKDTRYEDKDEDDIGSKLDSVLGERMDFFVQRYIAGKFREASSQAAAVAPAVPDPDFARRAAEILAAARPAVIDDGTEVNLGDDLFDFDFDSSSSGGEY